MASIEKSEVENYHNLIGRIRREVGKAIIGQENVINELIVALISNGHALVEGVPGIAKTLLVRALGRATGCEVKRVQFTVDLLPSDILGLTTYTKERGFEIIKGPIFANYVIADEINRSPPKTQSALFEAMQERQVTIGRETFQLPLPFFGKPGAQAPLFLPSIAFASAPHAASCPAQALLRWIFALMQGRQSR